MSARNKMQEQINHWMASIRELEEDLEELEPHSKEWEASKGAQREYKGRIYAARYFAEVLGVELDTDYLKIA